jgi:hypothetical protein
LTNDPRIAQRLWDCVPDLPTPIWGRDELNAGEMWNSNSIVSWLITRSGLQTDTIHPPLGGAGTRLERRRPDRPTRVGGEMTHGDWWARVRARPPAIRGASSTHATAARPVRPDRGSLPFERDLSMRYFT